ncbi:hypothetical protein [Paraburkholderia tropica]|uniref:hypothetical protein n=1 Tax=Paraburkholderia tropica TaxID=92647 RepID=UPI0038B73F3C
MHRQADRRAKQRLEMRRAEFRQRFEFRDQRPGEMRQTRVRDIAARELPREPWTPALKLAGLSDAHARLITDLYDVHNAGKIDVEFGQPERRSGTTELMEVFAPLVAKLRGARRLHQDKSVRQKAPGSTPDAARADFTRPAAPPPRPARAVAARAGSRGGRPSCRRR